MKVNFITHGGIFHADDVGAAALLILAGEEQNFSVNIYRVEDLEDVKEIGGHRIIADILRKHAPEEGIYDHHQGGLKRPNGMPYASFGLLWDEYWPQVVPQNPLQERVADRVDRGFIQGIDAHDDDPGYYVEAFCSAGEVRPYTISNLIASMNGNPKDTEGQMSRFKKAVALMADALASAISRAFKTENAIAKWGEVAEEAARDIFVLPKYMPWHEAVAEMEPEALFVIHPSGHPGSPWSLQAVPVKLGRRDLKMRIKRPDWFTGFIHNGQFIAGCASKEEAIKLALWHTGG